MASPSSSSTYSAYPTHPQHGGKGLPPQQPQSGIIGNPPDLIKRFKLKHQYLKIQKRYFQALEARKDLTLELGEKEAKQQKLQDEVDLIIDQIYDSDYKHLRPKKDDLFSEDEEEENQEDEDEEEGGLKPEEDLEQVETNRRRQLEDEFGVDSNRQTVNSAPPKTTTVNPELSLSELHDRYTPAAVSKPAASTSTPPTSETSSPTSAFPRPTKLPKDSIESTHPINPDISTRTEDSGYGSTLGTVDTGSKPNFIQLQGAPKTGGSTSWVYTSDDNKFVAKFTSESQGDELMHEATLMVTKLKGLEEFIVPFSGIYSNPELKKHWRLVSIFEYGGSTLRHWSDLNSQQKVHLAVGLGMIHSRGIRHDDLAPRNVVLQSPTSLPRWIDFAQSFTPKSHQTLDQEQSEFIRMLELTEEEKETVTSTLSTLT